MAAAIRLHYGRPDQPGWQPDARPNSESEGFDMKISIPLTYRGRWLAACSLLLGACAAPIIPGTSMESDVFAYFGKPADTRQLEGGRREFDYPRGPAGRETWRVTLSPEGRVLAVENLLEDPNFGRLKPKMTKQEVDRILGRHFFTSEFPNLGEEVWSWRYTEFGNRMMYFNAHFDAGSGLLKYASRTPDPLQVVTGRGRR